LEKPIPGSKNADPSVLVPVMLIVTLLWPTVIELGVALLIVAGGGPKTFKTCSA
jgi:hypothetical protein